VEGASFAAGEAALVEDAGDLGVAVVFEEVIDGGDDFGWGLSEFPGCAWQWEAQLAVLAAAEPDGDGDVLAADRVTSSTSRRIMRLRSRIGVAGSFHRVGKSVARTVIFACWASVSGPMADFLASS
jgi:hypothetical protein